MSPEPHSSMIAQNTALHEAVIMMVDDERINMEVIQIYLEDAGYNNFIICDHPKQAFELLRFERPDVLLLDLMMPEISGYDILRAVRADEAIGATPVIVLTSSTEGGAKLKALEAGATDFLAKPADPSELTLRIRNTLTAKAYHDQVAFYDHTTGLPNRKLFLKRLDLSIQHAEREGHRVGVINIVCEPLKQLSLTLSQEMTEKVIGQASQRIRKILRDHDIVYSDSRRCLDIPAVTGDSDFSVLLPMVRDANDAIRVANRMMAASHEAIHIDGNDIHLTPIFGIATFPEDAQDASELLAKASAASSYAKQDPRRNCVLYSREIHEQIAGRVKRLRYLHTALDNNELQLYYQPKIDPATGAMVGMEALLRWINPELGMVPPAEFIPLAEESGLIFQIGEWVILEACSQVSKWRAEGMGDVSVSVNVSAQQFQNQDVAGIVSLALQNCGLDPKYLVIEVTESMMMVDPERTIEVIKKLKGHGVSISIDDFGTGYSSFSYLKRFHMDELKIDRSFIVDIDDDSDHNSRIIVSAIIAMAHRLGLKVVAEGVETDKQLAILQQYDCDVIQGFYFSKPLPNQELSRYALGHNISRKMKSNG